MKYLTIGLLSVFLFACEMTPAEERRLIIGLQNASDNWNQAHGLDVYQESRPGRSYQSYSAPEPKTGGPYVDWDIFYDGDYRCRAILYTRGYKPGQFVPSDWCHGMPLDDDRW